MELLESWESGPEFFFAGFGRAALRVNPSSRFSHAWSFEPEHNPKKLGAKKRRIRKQRKKGPPPCHYHPLRPPISDGDPGGGSLKFFHMETGTDVS